jgi:hypothetical protein
MGEQQGGGTSDVPPDVPADVGADVDLLNAASTGQSCLPLPALLLNKDHVIMRQHQAETSI